MRPPNPRFPAPPSPSPAGGGIRHVEHVRGGYVAPPGLSDSGLIDLGFAKPHPRLSDAALRAKLSDYAELDELGTFTFSVATAAQAGRLGIIRDSA